MRRTLWVLSPAMARLAHASTTTGLLKAQRPLSITLLERPTIRVDGEIVGSWVQRPSGEIVVRVLTDVGDERRSAIADSAHALQKLLGENRFSRPPSRTHPSNAARDLTAAQPSTCSKHTVSDARLSTFGG